MIFGRYESEYAALKSLEFRGQGRVAYLPSEEWPSFPWCVIDD